MSYPRRIRGVPGTQYEDTTDRRHTLGQLMETDDGRLFRYVLNGAVALVCGDIIQGKAVVAADYLDVVVDVASAIGDTTISLTTTTTTAKDYYAGGYLVVNDAATAAAQGKAYKIKENVLFANTTGKVVTLEQWDPIEQPLAIGDEVGVVPDPYNGVVQAIITTVTSRVVGVAVVANTIARYGWVQTGGVCGINTNTNMAVGQEVTAILAAAGQGDLPSTTYVGDETLGYAMNVNATQGEIGAVFMTMDK